MTAPKYTLLSAKVPGLWRKLRALPCGSRRFYQLYVERKKESAALEVSFSLDLTQIAVKVPLTSLELP
jgi:hypothetical protein